MEPSLDIEKAFDELEAGAAERPLLARGVPELATAAILHELSFVSGGWATLVRGGGNAQRTSCDREGSAAGRAGHPARWSYVARVLAKPLCGEWTAEGTSASCLDLDQWPVRWSADDAFLIADDRATIPRR